MVKTHYTVKSDKITKDLKIAQICDLHCKPYGKIVDALAEYKPDLIVIPGDMLMRLDVYGAAREVIPEKYRENALGFEALAAFSKIAPSYYCPGNHDLSGRHGANCKNVGISPENLKELYATGVKVLDNSSEDFGEITIGGLSSALFSETGIPDLDWLREYDKGEKFKLLLCHHPEYYDKYLKDTKVDLVVSGHAHGGQWRLFGLSAYAPGQGVFPKYTSGMHDGRFIISRGLANHTPVPRIFNPTELVLISLEAKKQR